MILPLNCERYKYFWIFLLVFLITGFDLFGLNRISLKWQITSRIVCFKQTKGSFRYYKHSRPFYIGVLSPPRILIFILIYIECYAKTSGLNWTRTHDLCVTGAVLNQLSYQVNWELVTLRPLNISVDGDENKWIYERPYMWASEKMDKNIHHLRVRVILASLYINQSYITS